MEIKMVYVLLADGFEEIEALEPIDIMIRGGVEVKTVGVTGKAITGAHGICVIPDIELKDVDVETMEMLVLPGGAGHELLDASNAVHALISYAVANRIYIGAICAAPSILGKKMLLEGKKATCFPGFERFLYGANVVPDKVVTDGKFITAKGAGAAAEFGFTLLSLLVNPEKAENIREIMQY